MLTILFGILTLASSSDLDSLATSKLIVLKDGSLICLEDKDLSLELVQGGQETVRLTLNQMPRHGHDNSDQHGNFNGLLLNNCWSTRKDVDYSCGSPNLDRTMPIKEAGGDQPHNNMPPYLVLNICKKVYLQTTSSISNNASNSQQKNEYESPSFIIGLLGGIAGIMSLCIQLLQVCKNTSGGRQQNPSAQQQ